MLAFAYILQSTTHHRYYIGATTTSVVERLEKHNHSTYGFHFTSKANDWTIVLAIEWESFSVARKIELYIKRMKSRKFIELLVQEKQEVQKLINKMSNRLSR